MKVSKYPNRNIIINQKEFLYFGGTDYLGVQQDEAFITIIHHNLKKWGTSYGSSRDANIKLSIYDEFETYFASFLNFESSLSISSGTLAGFLVKEYYSIKKFKSFHIDKSHPAVIFKNSQSVFLGNNLHPDLLSDETEEIIICSDAILALQTEPTNFDFLDNINPNKKITLIIDESHSLGVLGKNGQGISAIINHPIIKRKIFISSLSKAYGVAGGIIASDREFINKLKALSLFSGAAGANPAILQTILDATDLFQLQLNKLKENLTYFYTRLNGKTQLNYSPNYPVIYYPAVLKKKFFDNDIVTTNFNYQDNNINRIIIKASHHKEDLDKLLKLIP